MRNAVDAATKVGLLFDLVCFKALRLKLLFLCTLRPLCPPFPSQGQGTEQIAQIRSPSSGSVFSEKALLAS